MPQTFRSRLIPLFAVAAALVLLGAGCQDAPPPAPNPPPEARFDVTATTCPGIAEARQKVADAYAASVRAASDAYLKARGLFKTDLDACLNGIWKGGPCDAEWEASQKAYQNASNDISNDQFYHEWKKAKADWDACHAQWEAKYKEWSDNNLAKERACKDEFQAKVDAAEQAYQDATKAARDKRDADNAFLDDLEKRCRETPPSGGGTTGGVTSGGTTGGTPTGGGTTAPPPTGGRPTTSGGTTYHPDSSACRDAVPGENAAPRQGRASDFGPNDILVNLLTTVAEDVTHTPLPTGAINDQLFAGLVCVKIRTRIAEMDQDSLDHITDNRWQRRYEQQRARYERALSVWCAIAAGRTTVPQVRKDAAAIGAMPGGGCKSDADCGEPICCSAQQVARRTCDVKTGACVAAKETCDAPLVCGGKPARCVRPPQMIKAIEYDGHYLPLDQLKIESEIGCGADHYHAKRGAVKATDGTYVSDPGPQCGYGKVRERPTVEVEAPAE